MCGFDSLYPHQFLILESLFLNENIYKKRRYWKRYNDKNSEDIVSLIETSVNDMGPSQSYNRKYFENILTGKFRESGVEVSKLCDISLNTITKIKKKLQSELV